MRIKQGVDNGNITTVFRNEHLLQRNTDNRSWIVSSDNNIETNSTYRNINKKQNFKDNSNTNYNISYESDNILENTTITATPSSYQLERTIDVELAVCNRQYRINAQKNINVRKLCSKEKTDNLEGPKAKSTECFLGDPDAYSNTTPLDEERAFDHSDTDEMSENGIQTLSRGIVNPNYPGFQHLAHTLQDYSSNIENFYQSENDMTDDDIDVEITELSYETECDQNSTLAEYKNINNNNNNVDIKDSKFSLSKKNSTIESKRIDCHINNDIPDLLKTISSNNNNINSNSCDSNYSDTDIENNFHTKDIIGDFNKEIEDEIKQLLNYNINIQDDLEELRKDIKETFAKPIETTINNISDVVNHVIKKLVETQTDVCDQCDDKQSNKENNASNEKVIEICNVNKENEKNTRTEMNLSRPTFLLLDSSSNTTIADAFLSDGKDEINIYDSEYDTERLSTNVENTIKQLSTELRKIIPKLDEMRERDKLWATCKKDTVVTDGNSNEIASSSKCFDYPFIADNSRKKSPKDVNTITNNSVKATIEPRTAKERQKETIYSKNNCLRSAQSTSTSVRNKNNSDRDCDLGSFDVYNIETALPKLDLDAIENHIKAAKEAERRKRNDREEIRRRLAMGADTEEYYSLGHVDRPGKKPSLHSRLQNASDNESQASDAEKNLNNKSLSQSSIFSKSNYNHPYQTRPLSVNITKHDKISTVQSGAKLRPTSLSSKPKTRSSQSMTHIELKESDFYALQATLQTEARIALAQAKEMARLQMERERRSRAVSPVTEMLRRSMEKANAPLAADRRRVSRQLLTDMNIAQLQVIVNELHSQIESLNDSLVKLLMARDELHMGQDSMLVDIEDLTRYLGVKEQTKKTKGTTKSGVRRLTSLVHK
ncbi:schwannomin-interacting protein 1 homolog isoform X2 [Galleria mellonella]|uniref:Schwannomin-interacting protein 1 homolog isoform X2 n=1 Tax=Galleria mellonella TaxID=7137 RepID=A0A6J3BT72_GALME|nr:schwannomin-interacting protein 1 homolog isoform X2 [Galleria mellonella]